MNICLYVLVKILVKKNYSMKNCFLLFFLFLIGCQSADDIKLEQALEFSKENRSELEKVLEHYKDSDELKLKAAKFLIRNMPGHISYKGKMIEKYYVEAEPILLSDSTAEVKEKLMNNLLTRYPSNRIERVQDIHIITSDYLIKNIDSAFEDWQNGSWAKQISFEDFCEYLLPYKCVDYQALDNWREALRPVCEGVYEDFQYSRIYQNSAYWAAGFVNDSLGRLIKIRLGDKLRSYSLFKVPFWTKIPSGLCGTYSIISLGILRSKGIPVVNDFILQWATKDSDHSWVTVLTENKNKAYCEGGEGGILGFMRPGECKGKVYRRTYAPNDTLIALNRESEYVPGKLRDVFMKDVTDEYVHTVKVSTKPLSDLKKKDETYAYLAVYGQKEWVPICFSEIKGNTIEFNNMEREAIYMPVYYTVNGVEPMNYPFLLDHNKKQIYLIPDKNKTGSIILHRKFPVMRRAFAKGKCLKGSFIHAANKADFSDADTIYHFKQFTLSGNIMPKDSATYRYWRYFCPEPYNCYIAELGFYNSKGEKMKGSIIGTGEYFKGVQKHSREAAFDEDPFTFYVSDVLKNGWIGMDFGKPVTVSKVNYLARSDDNNVRIGDLYELFYWDVNGWVSLGRQVATDLILKFDKVPDNALLILRDLTRGRDERIFVYKNGKQVWY